jgi:predicted Zn-dependent peptidase
MKITKEISNGNYNKTVLENGLTIVSEFVPEISSFSAGICINVGSRNDFETKEGIAHFMEHAAFRHTKNRTSKQIANEFEALGAYSNAFTTKEITCFYVRAMKEHFAKTFEILSDITLNTIFVEQEIEKEKLIILEEIKSYEDDPEEYICDLADTLVFAGSSLAPPIIGTQNSVNNISFSDLEKFHKSYYCPKNITIAAAGNISHSEIVTLAKKYFNTNAKSKTVNNNFCYSGDENELTVHRQIQQAHIMIGKLTNGIRHSERYPLAIANAMFGDGMSSRLYQNLREKHGLAYSIYSSVQKYIDCGAIYIYAATEENKNKKTVDLVFEEMQKFTFTKKPTQKELNRAKEQLKTATMIELESMSSRMQNLIKQEISICKTETISEIISNIEKITLDDIAEISQKYFVPSDWKICLLLPTQ